MGYNRLPDFIDESIADEIIQRLDAIERPAKKPRERWLAELKPKVLSLYNDGVSVKEIYDTINRNKRIIAEKEIQKMIGRATKRKKSKVDALEVSIPAADVQGTQVINGEPEMY